MTKYLVWIYQEGSERALLRAGDGQWHERAGGGAHCQLNYCNQVHHVAGPLVEKYIRQHLIFECPFYYVFFELDLGKQGRLFPL
jgi:hypothetical protein